jgi:hypothetical protein
MHNIRIRLRLSLFSAAEQSRDPSQENLELHIVSPDLKPFRGSIQAGDAPVCSVRESVGTINK